MFLHDHFPILFPLFLKDNIDPNIKTEQNILKQNIYDQSIEKF